MTALVLKYPPRKADIAEGVKQVELREITRHEAKRIVAINRLGADWVLHPQYDPAKHPNHSLRFKTSAVLAPIQARAYAQGRL